MSSSRTSECALVVDANDTGRRLLRGCLESLGYTVAETADSAAALRLVEEKIFAAVFIPANGSDGLRDEPIARRVRSRPGGESTLVIAVLPQDPPVPAGPFDTADAHLAPATDPDRVQTCLDRARRRRTSQTPAAARVLKTLQTYAEAFPGGMAGALTHCRSEILAEQSRLREASASGRWHDAARAAHNLGSIGAMTGLPVLHTTARAAENALRAADTPSIPPALEATRLSVETACQTLNGLIG